MNQKRAIKHAMKSVSARKSVNPKPLEQSGFRAGAQVATSESDPSFLANLGRRVREAREHRGMARKVLSRTAAVSERYLAQLEAGEGNASIVLLRRVAAA